MNFYHIAIEREYGSGATEIGQKLAQKTGMEFYGKELLELAAAEMNTTPAELQRLEEKSINSLLYTVEMLSRMQQGEVEGLPGNGVLHITERKIIQEAAKYKSSIFIGRSAVCSLNDRTDVLRVFIKSDREHRRKRAVQEYGIPAEDADSTLRKMDKRRANYFFSNTGHKWADPDNYDIILDSGQLGIDRCVDILSNFFTY